MNKTIVNRLLIIASMGLFLGGAIFLGISIFGNGGTTKPLAYALGCILLSNLFNLIRQLNGKNQSK